MQYTNINWIYYFFAMTHISNVYTVYTDYVRRYYRNKRINTRLPALPLELMNKSTPSDQFDLRIQQR